MGVQYTRALADAGQAFYRMSGALQGIVQDEMNEAGEESLQEAQSWFEMQGTGRSWGAPPAKFKTRSDWAAGGTGDREDTGRMFNALEFRLVQGANIGLDVGWIRHFEEYFQYQDQGFSATGLRTPGMNDHVRGMGVIAHIQVYTRDRVDEALDRAIERIVDGL